MRWTCAVRLTGRDEETGERRTLSLGIADADVDGAQEVLADAMALMLLSDVEACAEMLAEEAEQEDEGVVEVEEEPSPELKRGRADLIRQRSVAAKGRRRATCSECGEPGHNRLTCPGPA